MRHFTCAYLAQNPTLDASELPCYDLVAALRPANKLQTWGLEPAAEARMRDLHARFVAAAFAAISPTPNT